ncbi:AAA family ATPase [Teredinibacter turnerae]|uniref:AAA family ATPase n=1 Tax=Teredinibacter turnerae TaxID=2426 RepID=UPI00035F8D68|nr:AAA family ATPase [Teredinibacter turnerae]
MLHLPPELLELDQWIAADTNKRPISPHSGKLASVTDSSTWASFEEAKKFAEQNDLHLGFVFTHDDPFVFIDLDNKECDENRARLHSEILQSAGDTYIERSLSGKGYHIVLRGEMELGRRNSENGLEIYPHERYMLVTGDCVGAQSIAEGQQLVNYLVGQCDKQTETPIAEVYRPPQLDEQILQSARASYRVRFDALWSGNWQKIHESQSEADLELCGKLAEYTSDDAQVQRLFLLSGLGQRDKAKRSDYLEKHTIPKARKIGDRERSAFEHGKTIAEDLLKAWKDGKRVHLIPFGEFINRQVAILKLIKGILGESGLSVLYGAPGAGKSFLALDLCYAVANGENWMGREVSQGAVIYACGEGVSGLSRRAAGIAKAKGNSNPPMYILPTALSTPDEIEQFKEMLAEVTYKTGAPPKLLVLDTLSRYYGDGEDENSAKDMKRFIKSVASIMEGYSDLHIMIVHHSGKDADRGMRGSSVLLGAADTVLSCLKNNDQHIALVEKQKDGQENIPLPFVLEQVELGEDDEGEPITTCIVKPDFDGRAKPLKGYQAQAVDILRKLKTSVDENVQGNLAGVTSNIPFIAYINHWKDTDPKAKSDTVRKRARRILEELAGKKLVTWAGGSEDIITRPELNAVTIELD